MNNCKECGKELIGGGGKFKGVCKKCRTYKAGKKHGEKRKHDEKYKNKEKARLKAIRKARSPDYLKQVRRINLLKRYGISLAEYDFLLEKQKNGCAICGQQSPQGTNLAVDHDHKTGKVRGLLCTKCNTTLGLVNDSKLILQKCIEYLEDSHINDIFYKI